MNGRIYRGNTIYLTPGEIEAWAKKKNYTFEAVAKRFGMSRMRFAGYLARSVPRKWDDPLTREILAHLLPPGKNSSYWAPPDNRWRVGELEDMPISTCDLPHAHKNGKWVGRVRRIQVFIRPDVLQDWLTRTGYNKSQAAAILGVGRTVFYRWLKEGVKQKRFARHVMNIIRD
jgi:predicted DNA-binding protein (UPF0251 family)